MRGVLILLIACSMLGGASLAQDRVALRPGTLLYAMPGISDPNFTRTVVLLLEHGDEGSVGVVLNQPTTRRVDRALDLTTGPEGIDLPVYRGGPVQPEAVLLLVRTLQPGPKARTILREVYLTSDLNDVKQLLTGRDGRLRVRVFSGYAGWGRGQLVAEVRTGTWVLEPADAATVFSTEPSRMWEKVREILRRLSA